MPETGAKIFVSYRRDDSLVYSKLIADELGRHFSDENVFIDLEGIAYGEDWEQTIDTRISGCDAVVVVIGPQWGQILANRSAEGGVDYVRREIASALAGRKCVIPVFVAKAGASALANLPEDLGPLRTINAIPFDERYLKQCVTALADAIRGRPLSEIAPELAGRIRSARRAWVVGTAVGIVTFVAVSLSILDLLTVDTRMASLTMWLAGLGSARPQADNIQLVTIDEATEKQIGRPFDGTWRREHAQLVDHLSAAGARTIAFDIWFKVPMPAEDEVLGTALASAQRRGTAIVASVVDGFAGQTPSPRLQQVLGTDLAGGERGYGWGITCAGTKLNYARSMLLAVERDHKLLPSFALAAFSGGGRLHFKNERFQSERALSEADLEIFVSMPAGGGLETVGFSSIEDLGNPSETAVRDCPVLDKKDRVALQLLVPSPPGFWLASPRRISYERVLSASTGDEALRSMKGKIVLVGATLDRPGMSRSFRDILHVAMGFGSEQRFGIELIADQIAAIERRRVIRPLEGWAQLVLIITMALVGATAQRWGAGRLPLVRLAAFGGLGIAYVLTIVLIYRVSHVLLNVPYEVGACVLAYWGMKRTDWGAPLRDASRRVLRERSMAKEPDGVASR